MTRSRCRWFIGAVGIIMALELLIGFVLLSTCSCVVMSRQAYERQQVEARHTLAMARDEAQAAWNAAERCCDDSKTDRVENFYLGVIEKLHGKIDTLKHCDSRDTVIVLIPWAPMYTRSSAWLDSVVRADTLKARKK